MSKHTDKIKEQFRMNQSGGFGGSETDNKEPKNGDILTLALEQIDYSPLNPRKMENPKFDDIKESIQNIGLQNQLIVTKRPGDEHYTLFNGGNTRLKALKELFSETQDEKFYIQQCSFRKYQSDSDVLINHMIENEERGEMLLIDKARAAYQLKELYEKDSNDKLSARKLSAVLKQNGWNCDPSLITIFIFTVEKIADYLPEFLTSGAGRPKLKNIRSTYNDVVMFMDNIPLYVENMPINKDDAIELYLTRLANWDSVAEDFNPKYPFEEWCSEMEKITKIENGRVLSIMEWIRDFSSFPHDETPDLINGPPAVYPDKLIHEEKLAKQKEQDLIREQNKKAEPVIQDNSDIAPENYQNSINQDISKENETFDEFADRINNSIIETISPFGDGYPILEGYLATNLDTVLMVDLDIPNAMVFLNNDLKNHPLEVQYFILKTMGLQAGAYEVLENYSNKNTDNSRYEISKNIYKELVLTVGLEVNCQRLINLDLDKKIRQVDKAFDELLVIYQEIKNAIKRF